MEILNKYQTKGSFTFLKGERLSSKCGTIPNEPGVYLIYAIKNMKKELVYIGASGKMNQNGTFKIQKLRKRIQNQRLPLRTMKMPTPLALKKWQEEFLTYQNSPNLLVGSQN